MSLGIRREDKNRWERRVPLAPYHVKDLIAQGIPVYVQPSNLRVFSDDEYRNVGATVQEDLSPAGTIIAVKEVPPEKLLPDKTYMFFSHTIKAQPSNMPMLDSIIEKNIRLIDYEKITDARGTRLVRFGKFAGFAGMIDMLRILGERLLVLGYSTPFLNIGYSHMYPRLDDAKKAVVALGEEIKRVGLPRALSPMTFVFTGSTGNVAAGALEIFKLLPHEFVQPSDLPSLVPRAAMRASGSWGNLADASAHAEEAEKKRHTLYALMLNAQDYMEPIDPNMKFAKDHYYKNPQLYKSVFHEKIAPYMSVMVNCAYWDQKYPRMLTAEQMRDLNRQKKNRLIGIADISCDINGGVEFMHKSTSIDRPTFVYDIETGAIHDGFEGRGVILLAVDNLPTELPREASIYFGDSLSPLLPAVCKSNLKGPLEVQKTSLPRELFDAMVTSHKALTPRFAYITELRRAYESKIRHVLLLGSGFVSPPVVDLLLRNSANQLTVASQEIEQARKLVQPYSSIAAVAVHLDLMADPAKLDLLVQKHELVISLVPAALHPRVAAVCIKHQKHLITASYISPDMRALDAAAKEAGVLLLNEIGLDPGIDHMSALDIIADVHKQGGKITSFKSVCGGLPAPEAANNPLGYKFSWYPKGVLLSGLNAAKHRLNGKEINVPGDKIFSSAEIIDIEPCFSLEVLPNRDSLGYCASYGLNDVETMFRGTLRYKGYSAIMNAFLALGLLDSHPLPYLAPGAPAISWPHIISNLLPAGSAPLQTRILQKLGLAGPEKRSEASRVTSGLEWLGFFEESNVATLRGTPIDTLCALLEQTLTFQRNERDMVLLAHEFSIKWPDYVERRTSTLIAYGETNGYTAMARTVGVPVAVAAQMVLDGEIKHRGVVAPFHEDIFHPILQKLKAEGISFIERSDYL